MTGQVLAVLVAEEDGARMTPLEFGPRGTVTDDDLRARQVQVQEVPDALLDRDAAEVQPEWSRQAENVLGTRPEQPAVDPAAPGHDIAKAALLQPPAHGRRGDQRACGRAVEPPGQPVAGGQRQRKACPDVLRKLGVVGTGEGAAVAAAPAPCSEPEWPLGRDVYRVGIVRHQVLTDVAACADRQPDLGVGRARQGPEPFGRDDVHVVARRHEMLDRRRQAAHHPVHLGKPGVGHQGDPHATATSCPGSCAGRSSNGNSRSPTRNAGDSVQRSSPSLPEKSSTRAVQLSTQSPSLQ